MGILDEAIREHLELKRQHGAEESELEGLESQAFGPAERPDATEAKTQVISPGSSLTAPAGEGDQLDKVFEASRQAEQEASESPEAEQTATEHELPPDIAQTSEPTETEAPSEVDDDSAAEAQEPEAEAAAESPEQASEVEPPAEAEAEFADDDAGDALERERQSLSDSPTEHYDVDAAIAEEDEIDVLSESSLSDELDRALDGPPEETADVETLEREPVPAEESADPDPNFDDEHLGEPEDSGSDDGGTDEEDSGEFFDQNDPLEATPDFLEETPEHDRLWFEQKPPKDFEFGD